MTHYRSPMAQRMAEDPKYAEKQRAREAVAWATRRGTLVKPADCSRCGATPARRELHAHHADYAKPLEVEWLCRTCHATHHAVETRRIEAERRARLRDMRFRINPAPHD